MAQRKKQVRFMDFNDLKLLKEVVAQNPFKDKKWRTIAAILSTAEFVIDGRRARERTDLLVEKFKQKENVSEKSSGVVEDYDEKQMLLQEITELMEEEIRVQEENREQSNTQEIKAKEIRKRASFPVMDGGGGRGRLLCLEQQELLQKLEAEKQQSMLMMELIN
ncbi:uncharacterized protein LOC121369981 [Gigantopelta aegis]|uniref:uncharacterized protein LOC121369981 n=1 Tax=Gigantopelta aegis TaxID=1735272 RepID=UPI001B88894E|nr:uncharacterized protein LOC121369981 [Gigantopelta aegis]